MKNSNYTIGSHALNLLQEIPYVFVTHYHKDTLHHEPLSVGFSMLVEELLGDNLSAMFFSWKRTFKYCACDAI